ncbi:multiubiquitin [Pseudoduganella lurida]|uniref:Multiubiquitin n=1 Tax=Pseudoduganella lurida TaxID=1036180 RepID=A0A562R5N8_9BURK|nr:multiubiquitin domain-containing protein [Pseudoduganella lurida]TWI64378.1 multiubiquitin [Pseudoduganella lurida]
METKQLSQHPGVGAIEVCGLDLVLRPVAIHDTTPTGMQIAEAAGYAPTPLISVLQWLMHGLEDVRPTEVVNLRDGLNRFIIAESEATWRLIIDGIRFDWPSPRILVSVLRTLAAVPTTKSIFLTDPDQGEIYLADDTELDLTAPGVEALVTHAPSFKLNVQGVLLSINAPTVVVRNALQLAGISTDQGWHIFLIVQDQDKREVQLDDVIDLTTPGIEKLRLTPKDVDNGEASPSAVRQFRLLPSDETYLDSNHPEWMAIVENGRQWLLLPTYDMPTGYLTSATSLAVEVPQTYPMTQLDMFYVNPPATLASGATIPATEMMETIQGLPYQRWSRHRGGRSQWRPGIDNVISHLALVEAALLKEIQQ